VARRVVVTTPQTQVLDMVDTTTAITTRQTITGPAAPVLVVETTGAVSTSSSNNNTRPKHPLNKCRSAVAGKIPPNQTTGLVKGTSDGRTGVVINENNK